MFLTKNGTTFTVEGEATGKQAYFYYIYGYKSKKKYVVYGPYLGKSGIAPFSYTSDSFSGGWYRWCKVLVTAEKISEDRLDQTNHQITGIPDGYWYYYNMDPNATGLYPRRSFYQPGDVITIKNRTDCSSSSSSCHHTTSAWYYVDGIPGGNSNYHNHSGNASANLTIPNDRNSHKLGYSLQTTCPDTYDKFSKIYTVYDYFNNKSETPFNPFGALPIKIKVNGSWVDCKDVYVKVNGSWITGKDIYVKVNGSWTKC